MLIKTLSFTRNYPGLRAINTEICAEVQRHRERLDYSQAKFAKLFGITHTRYARFERGELRITAAELVIMCDVLHIGIETFFPKPATLKVHSVSDYPGE